MVSTRLITSDDPGLAGAAPSYTARSNQRGDAMMKQFLIILVWAFLWCLPVLSQVPTFVQHVSCPNSRNSGNSHSSTPDYLCPLPEPSQAGNALLVGVMSTNGGEIHCTFTVS